jgi:hypothetical protein
VHPATDATENDQKEVIEMTDGNTETTSMSWYADYTITYIYEEKSNG